MAKIQKRSQPKKNQEQRFTLTLWIIGIVAALLLVFQHVFYDKNDALLRLVVIVFTIGIATVVLFWQSNWRLRDVVDFDVDPTLIILSGCLGLGIWAIGWWLMAVIQEDILFEVVGDFQPPSIYLPNNLQNGWIWLVFGDVVLIPLGIMILLWGGLRQQFQNTSIWQVVLLSAGYLGLFGALLFEQGIVGLLGFGLCGVASGIASYYTQSVWTGFATHATFMYASRAFLDDLLFEMTFENESGRRVPEPYFGVQWLSLVLITSLVCIALIQIIRFRSNLEPGEKSTALPVSTPRWGAIALSVIVFVLLIIDEAQRRG